MLCGPWAWCLGEVECALLFIHRLLSLPPYSYSWPQGLSQDTLDWKLCSLSLKERIFFAVVLFFVSVRCRWFSFGKNRTTQCQILTTLNLDHIVLSALSLCWRIFLVVEVSACSHLVTHYDSFLQVLSGCRRSSLWCWVVEIWRRSKPSQTGIGCPGWRRRD